MVGWGGDHERRQSGNAEAQSGAEWWWTAMAEAGTGVSVGRVQAGCREEVGQQDALSEGVGLEGVASPGVRGLFEGGRLRLRCVECALWLGWMGASSVLTSG